MKHVVLASIASLLIAGSAMSQPTPPQPAAPMPGMPMGAGQPAPLPSAQAPAPAMKGMGMMKEMMGMERPMPSAPMPGMVMAPNAGDSAATQGYKAAMMKMVDGMPTKKFTGDADVDFMTEMRVHHQGAIDMARIVLANGKDESVKTLAQEIISAQEKEIWSIDAWLKGKVK